MLDHVSCLTLFLARHRTTLRNASHMPSHRQSTIDGILDGAEQVFYDRGYQDASIRKIAETSGVAVSTIRSIYADKLSIMKAMLRRLLQNLDGVVPDPSGDLRKDLLVLAERYIDFLTGYDAFIMIVPDIIRSPELRHILKEGQERMRARLTLLCVYYRDEGKWAASLQALKVTEISDQISSPFLGALFSHVTSFWLTASGSLMVGSDLSNFVDRFLEGHGARSQRRQEYGASSTNRLKKAWDDVLERLDKKSIHLGRLIHDLGQFRVFATTNEARELDGILKKLEEHLEHGDTYRPRTRELVVDIEVTLWAIVRRYGVQ